MISSVKLFSKEELHIKEQKMALNKIRDIMTTHEFFRSLLLFLVKTFNTVAFCVALYLSVSMTDMFDVNSGGRRVGW